MQDVTTLGAIQFSQFTTGSRLNGNRSIPAD